MEVMLSCLLGALQDLGGLLVLEVMYFNVGDVRLESVHSPVWGERVWGKVLLVRFLVIRV